MSKIIIINKLYTKTFIENFIFMFCIFNNLKYFAPEFNGAIIRTTGKNIIRIKCNRPNRTTVTI